MKDAGLIIEYYGVPCHCRCHHCSLQWKGRVSAVPYERAQGVAEKFLQWREAQGPPDFHVDFRVGYSYDFPQLGENFKFRTAQRMEGAAFLPANGLAFRSKPQLEKWLSQAQDAGMTLLGLTFFGWEASHDQFAGRKGDFEFLLLLAELAAARGLKRQETLFLRKNQAADYPPLLQALDRIPGRVGRNVGPWDYRGKAKHLESERIDRSDFEGLPPSVLQCLDRERLRTEAEWLPLIRNRQIPEKKVRSYCLFVREDNIEELEAQESCDILVQLQRREEAFYRSFPPLPELAEWYGKRQNQKLYQLRDLEWKWEERYFENHPELHCLGPFEELKCSSIRK